MPAVSELVSMGANAEPMATEERYRSVRLVENESESKYGNEGEPMYMLDGESITGGELEALHEVELGIERLHRAHGHLVAFHHNVGRGMNHLAAAESHLTRSEHHELADALRDEYLPRGVIAGDSNEPTAGRWTYDVLENFQRVFLDDIVAFGAEVHETVGDGSWHARERLQERDWKRRARRR